MTRFLFFVLLFFRVSVEGRNISFRVKLSDPGRRHAMTEADVFKFTEIPSLMPSDAPSLVPSISPTKNPSSLPTGTPTSPYEKVCVLGGLDTSITIQTTSNMVLKLGAVFIVLRSTTPGLNGLVTYGGLISTINATVIGDQAQLMFAMEWEMERT